MAKKKNNYLKVLFKGHVIHAGDLVSATGTLPEHRGSFRVVRVWGHHVTLEPGAPGDGEKAIPIIVDVDISA